jgi:hypothetical protein
MLSEIMWHERCARLQNPMHARLGATHAANQTLKSLHLVMNSESVNSPPAYEADDGPLTEKQLKAIRTDAQKRLPGGRVLSRAVLFAPTHDQTTTRLTLVDEGNTTPPAGGLPGRHR